MHFHVYVQKWGGDIVKWDSSYTNGFTFYLYIIFIFSHLADAFIQSDLQMRTTEAINCSIKTTKTDPKLKAKNVINTIYTH